MNQLATKDATAVVIPEHTKELIRAGVSHNTLKAYGWALQRLEEWLAINERKLDDAVLAEYITHLHESGQSPATIAQAVAAVKWQAKNADMIIVGPITDRTLTGIRRDGRERGRGQVDGLTREGVFQVVSRAEAADTLAGLRDSAMIRLMSDCLLRISEAVAVDIENIDTTLTIRSSKTDQEGKGESLFIGEPTLEAIDTYCKAGEIESGALFRRIRRGGHITPERLTVISARRIIKKWAKAAGIEGFISGHSLRVGTAVSLAQSGATLVDMQTAGRWGRSQDAGSLRKS